MVGIIIVAHFKLAEEMVNAVNLIVGKQEQLEPIGMSPNDDMENVKKKITNSIKAVDSGDGVIILTDMFGGTPSNISLSFLEEGKVEVVTGVNLPMLIKLATYRKDKPIGELARFITSYGQKNIYLATDVLKSRGKE
ncbi:MAG TPA: PTS sugar transporter subunit IIA [Syntrophorhabdaceae bacterium]|nr:PTS sugar transporter subunit IIA [Syntrophorhabdaceae bacterium]HOL05558.1 PTS sugar transporter subunit IIA [Syntrophorhabdaceae bacterium]HON86159.1 PTS sugar transporter subunit IIA [Syntrophorhabdaceae bacterium]HOT42466.1 PTS sugar transporter subunit IIA [Syntrophorhabdaceae bacterium]HPC67453.1 PTS sugar transporter subunit IIA [Syntrophorhabdaceae bacterium]